MDDDIHESARQTDFSVHWLSILDRNPSIRIMFYDSVPPKHAQCPPHKAMHQPLLIHSLTYGAEKYRNKNHNFDTIYDFDCPPNRAFDFVHLELFCNLIFRVLLSIHSKPSAEWKIIKYQLGVWLMLRLACASGPSQPVERYLLKRSLVIRAFRCVGGNLFMRLWSWKFQRDPCSVENLCSIQNCFV